MKNIKILSACALVAAMAALTNCSSGGTGGTGGGSAFGGGTGGAGGAGGGSASTLYSRLGGNAGITTVINDFLGRVVADPEINGYFLNSSVNAGTLGACLVKQVGSATGGPEVYDCRSMKAAHTGLGISRHDFNVLVGHLVDALTKAGVATADINTIAGVLGPMDVDIIEDDAGTKTVYQRVGRKPAIQAVIDGFLGKVLADARINGFFTTTNATRLRTCLVRQVCGIDGPCKYGQEVTSPKGADGGDVEGGVDGTHACRTMLATHAGLKQTDGGSIRYEEFGDLVGDLVSELDMAGVSTADKNAILGALGPMCSDIVAPGSAADGGTGCP